MSTPRALTRLPLRKSTLLCSRRSFLTLPDSGKPQHVAAARRLPYHHAALYDLIADIDSYTQFLPYCKVSRVTRWTTPHPATTTSSPDHRWPTRADLTAGWGGFEETYTSRVFCVPSLGVVEAISGDARTEIPLSDLQKAGLTDPGPGGGESGIGTGEGGVFTSLVTRWTVTPVEDAAQHDWSDVRLSIRYRFANPLYTAVSGAVADKVAPVMIEAFVEQARRVLGETGKNAETLR